MRQFARLLAVVARLGACQETNTDCTFPLSSWHHARSPDEALLACAPGTGIDCDVDGEADAEQVAECPTKGGCGGGSSVHCPSGGAMTTTYFDENDELVGVRIHSDHDAYCHDASDAKTYGAIPDCYGDEDYGY